MKNRVDENVPTTSPHEASVKVFTSKFTSLRKSFRRLKQKRKPAQNAASSTEQAEDNIKPENSINNLKKWSFRKKTRLKTPNRTDDKKNDFSSQFNIVQWASLESLTEEKSFNSLRRSRNSLFLPIDYTPKKNIKIPKYIKSDSCMLSSSNTETHAKKKDWSSEHNLSNDTDIVPYKVMKNILHKKNRSTSKKMTYALSLPDISETIGDDEFSAADKEAEFANCLEKITSLNHENILLTKNDKENNNFSSNDINVLTNVDKVDYPLQNNLLKNVKKHHSASTPSLNRPPLPSVPKPITRRDKVLKSLSSEYLASKDSMKQNNTVLRKALQRAFSDFVLVSFDGPNVADTISSCPESSPILSSAVKENLCTKPERNEWKEKQYPIAIADAVWDHTSLCEDELSFKSGDEIAVLFMDDENWWWGTNNQQEGWFPAPYIRLRVDQGLDYEGSLPSKVSRTPTIKSKSREQMMLVRAACVEELLTTEKVYVNLLKNIIQGYLKQVESETCLFSPQDVEVLFGNIKELCGFHQTFLADLERAVTKDAMENSNVGHVFLKHQLRFEMYSVYCNNQPRSSAKLSSLSKEKKFNVFFESCRLRQGMIRLSLDGFLLSPVQRICKYPLQLKELIKHTVDDHPDYCELLQARSCMQQVAWMVNERKRRLENVNKLAKWQLSVAHWREEDVVEKSSSLILKGTAREVVSGRYRDRMLFLFDHQLVILRTDPSKKNVLTYHARVYLNDTLVLDDMTTVNGGTVGHGWKIWCGRALSWYHFSVDSAALKDGWLNAFKEERRSVLEEIEKGFVVLPEVRTSVMETANRNHHSERRKLRRKSVCTSNPTDLETSSSFATVVEPLLNMGKHTEEKSVVTRRKEKNKTFRLSLQGCFFEKNF